MIKMIKLGSLFDGSGGFPLAGVLCGVEPVWAAEIEPYPIAVTRERFDGSADNPIRKLLNHHHPEMKLYMTHLGDISKINGAEIEPVDIITFGSPCQDLSVAGKRAGIKHEDNGDEETTRSGLFMEAVRIIKEMRRATNGQYPRFALWENVPGAFSSNKGEDFRIVCEELIKIVEPSASMPSVPQRGWNYADSFIGDGWSLAYRVFDAQYWGVPQRRRRIHLVADFRGERAREILFEREGLRGYFTESRTPWQAAPTDAQGSTGADDREGEGCVSAAGWPLGFRPENVRLYDEVSTTICNGTRPGFCNGIVKRGDRRLDAVAYSFDSLASNSMKSSNPLSGCREVEVAKTLDTTDPNPSKNQGGIAVVQPVPYTLKIRSGCEGGGKGALVQCVLEPICYDARGNGDGKTVSTLTGDHENRITDYSSVICMATQQGGAEIRTDDKAPTLTAAAGMSGNNQPVICLQGNGIDRADTAGCNGKGWKEDTCYTLNTIDRPAVAYGLDRASFNQGQNAKFDFSITEESQPTLTAKGPDAVAYADEPITLHGNNYASTLKARDYKGAGRWDSLGSVVSIPTATQYIVRRLTPTECARLQGFADEWGHVAQKDNLTEEEFNFWHEVRNTHAAINGKKVQDYTPKQMLAWYNKLWTDSAEYKMWGNGIALPPALYCMQGIVEALEKECDQCGKD